jgi:hypothetical protein
MESWSIGLLPVVWMLLVALGWEKLKRTTPESELDRKACFLRRYTNEVESAHGSSAVVLTFRG